MAGLQVLGPKKKPGRQNLGKDNGRRGSAGANTSRRFRYFLFTSFRFEVAADNNDVCGFRPVALRTMVFNEVVPKRFQKE